MSSRESIHIRNGRLIDPVNGIDEPLDLFLQDGKILSLGQAPTGFTADTIIDASNQIVCPGLIDIAVHLREPGQEYKATIESETAAAARGGITTLVCTPDTLPVIDTPAVWELIRRRAKACGNARVLAIGALTQGLEGTQLSEMAALKEAGCVAVGNANSPLCSTLVERRALEYAATFRLPVILHAQDKDLEADGCAHEGAVSTRLGLSGIPSAAETVAVARDLALTEHTGARTHFHALSTATAVRMIRDAQGNQLSVSADVAIHQLHLTEMDLDGFNSNCHLIPPLRTLADRQALRAAVAQGTIGTICSDHQPHDSDAKERPFGETAPGIAGLETLLPLTLKLVDEGLMDMATAISRLTAGPASTLDLPFGQLSPGSSADVCIFDPQALWQLNSKNTLSAGHNTPFGNWELKGRVSHTIFEGRITYRQSD